MSRKCVCVCVCVCGGGGSKGSLFSSHCKYGSIWEGAGGGGYGSFVRVIFLLSFDT